MERLFEGLDEKRIVSLKLVVLFFIDFSYWDTFFSFNCIETTASIGSGANKRFVPKCRAHSRRLFEQIFESITYGETRDLWKRLMEWNRGIIIKVT